jgi:hypothetical protein
MTILVTVPLHTVNESNSHTHWRMRAKRASTARHVVTLALNATAKPSDVRFPCVVWLTRMSMGTLDDDGAASACKATRDAVAAWLGVDDGEVDKVAFGYSQAKCGRGQHSVRIEIISRAKLYTVVKKLEDEEKSA